MEKFKIVESSIFKIYEDKYSGSSNLVKIQIFTISRWANSKFVQIWMSEMQENHNFSYTYLDKIGILTTLKSTD